ncbi:UNVERIFIED_CONTAM: hypothetical protein K2H54_014941 [Gekko kuhli]
MHASSPAGKQNLAIAKIGSLRLGLGVAKEVRGGGGHTHMPLGNGSLPGLRQSGRQAKHKTMQVHSRARGGCCYSQSRTGKAHGFIREKRGLLQLGTLSGGHRKRFSLVEEDFQRSTICFIPGTSLHRETRGGGGHGPRGGSWKQRRQKNIVRCLSSQSTTEHREVSFPSPFPNMLIYDNPAFRTEYKGWINDRRQKYLAISGVPSTGTGTPADTFPRAAKCFDSG